MTDDNSVAEWMYNRLRKQGLLDEHLPLTAAPPWAELHEDEHKFWEHEANAYQRAFARGGFKDYDPEMSKQ